MTYRDHLITSAEQLRALYGEKSKVAVIKEIDHISSGYRKLIEAAPFVAVATAGPEGLDCSPKGDAPGFVRVIDDKTLALPDRPGNNRIDGFTNILRDPRIALLFLIPGVGETLRVNGRASITVDPELMQGFAVDGKLPRCVLVVHVERIYFHCSKAIVRARLWDEAAKLDRNSLPSTGTLIAELSRGELGGEAYDREAPERIKAALY
ncbi:MAG TPA: pyridoxamine 5'-phosphate oxidase family protein [Burkholderiales bacterium]|nr:pyridoxamine 5'-phosphate oxidase family protein [Burkholderiales bacterium]